MAPLPSSRTLPPPAADPVPADAVREQLARVVTSPGFVSSVRLSRFLTHIVNRTIDGDVDSLRELSIALEVFDRSTEYDPSIDAIVRVEARRLRAKLKAYYEEGPGAADPVLIGLRPGSYVPVFRWLGAPVVPPREDFADAGLSRRCVAVLPFVNMSPEPEQDYFCDGITEEITNSLTRVPALNVIARTSSFYFKGSNIDIREVGQRLGADLVIEGSVRKAGEQLRITAQIIEAASGHHLWSETYRRELRDVFAVQEEIAHSVTSLLRLSLPEARKSAPEPLPSLDVYTSYLRARFLIHQQSPEALQAALKQLRSLVEAHSSYAPAYSDMAMANGLLAQFGVVSGSEIYPQVKADAERGFALDPESGETCTVFAGLRGWFEYQWQEAMNIYDRAVQLQPGHARAHMFRAMTLLCQRDIEGAESGLRRSAELDPLSASDCARMAYVQYVKGNDSLAAAHLRNAFQLDRDYPEARFYEGLLLFRQQQYDELIERLSGSNSPLDVGLCGAACAKVGSAVRAKECIERLDQIAAGQHVTPLAKGLVAIGMGDFAMAFPCLGDAIRDKTNFMNLLAVEPVFDSLRDDRRFAKLLNKLNLPG